MIAAWLEAWGYRPNAWREAAEGGVPTKAWPVGPTLTKDSGTEFGLQSACRKLQRHNGCCDFRWRYIDGSVRGHGGRGVYRVSHRRGTSPQESNRQSHR